MSLIARCDAVVADLSAHAGLPSAFKVLKYQRPLVVTPAMCPMLAVFPKEADPQLISTSSDYEHDDVLIVAWFEAAAQSLETGVFDQAIAATALAHAESIVQRLETYGAGIVGYSAEQNEAMLGKARYGHVEGGTWASEIELKVTTWT